MHIVSNPLFSSNVTAQQTFSQFLGSMAGGVKQRLVEKRRTEAAKARRRQQQQQQPKMGPTSSGRLLQQAGNSRPWPSSFLPLAIPSAPVLRPGNRVVNSPIQDNLDITEANRDAVMKEKEGQGLENQDVLVYLPGQPLLAMYWKDFLQELVEMQLPLPAQALQAQTREMGPESGA